MNLRLLEAADNPHTPSWQLGFMTLFASDATVATAIAQNLNTPKWAASWLSTHESPTVREAVAGRCRLGDRFLSSKARHRLLGDRNPIVRDKAELAHGNKWPPVWLREDQTELSVFGS